MNKSDEKEEVIESPLITRRDLINSRWSSYYQKCNYSAEVNGVELNITRDQGTRESFGGNKISAHKFLNEQKWQDLIKENYGLEIYQEIHEEITKNYIDYQKNQTKNFNFELIHSTLAIVNLWVEEKEYVFSISRLLYEDKIEITVKDRVMEIETLEIFVSSRKFVANIPEVIAIKLNCNRNYTVNYQLSESGFSELIHLLSIIFQDKKGLNIIYS